MKFLTNIIILLLYSISINITCLKSFNLNLDQSFDSDPDEMIYKIKNFLDVYSKQLQNKRYKKVSKVYVPTTNKTHNSIQYIETLNLDEVKQDVESFIDFVKKIQEKDMKNKREEKQQLEEKNIDYSTKNKILTSRINLANNEVNLNYLKLK